MWGENDEKLQAVLPAGTGVTREGAQDAGEVRQTAHMAEDYTRRADGCHALDGWPRWWWASALVLLLAVLGVPSAAYASESWGTVDGPFVTGQTTNNEGYVVLNVGSQYDAALCVIGRGSDKIQLSNEQFAKLSNASTGGRFYEFAQTFTALGNDGSANHFVGWWGDTLYQANMVSLNGGYGHVWATETNQSKIASALEDYMVIYNGGSIGGGSSDGYYFMWTKNGTDRGERIPFTFASDEVEQQFVNWFTKNGQYENRGLISIDNNFSTMNAWQIPNAYEIVYNANGNATALKNTSSSSYVLYNKIGCSYTVNFNANGNSVDSITIRGLGINSYDHSLGPGTSIGIGGWQYIYEVSSSGGSGGGGFIPDTNWPDTPSDPAPTAPELPEPDNPIPTPPQPTTPTPEPDVTIPSNPDLSSVLDAMNEHCMHLQLAIFNGLDNLYDGLTDFEYDLYAHWVGYVGNIVEWLDDWLNLFNDKLDTYFANDKQVTQAIMRYVNQILQAVNSLITGGGDATDVTGIEGQLDTIISKLDALLVIEGVDAALDLAHFLLDLLGELLDTIGSVVSGVTQTFGELTEVFPFSIPWDIAAIAALFAAEPVTPIFDIPFPAIAGGQGTLIHVDLSDFDGIASVGRAGILILFASGLALRTPALMGVGSDDVA